MSKNKLHYTTITPILHEVLKTVMAAEEFNAFRLVGGTALSLQRGHRESVDIDMFTDVMYRTVDFNAIERLLQNKYEYVDTSRIEIVGMGKPYFVGKSKNEGVKVDVFYTDEFIQDAIVVDGIRMATVEEIIAMKLEVISHIGRKKDFWDIHDLIAEYSLDRMIALHEKRYPYTHDADLIKKNFIEFTKADEDFDPVCFKQKSWDIIKADIIDFVK